MNNALQSASFVYTIEEEFNRAGYLALRAALKLDAKIRSASISTISVTIQRITSNDQRLSWYIIDNVVATIIIDGNPVKLDAMTDILCDHDTTFTCPSFVAERVYNRARELVRDYTSQVYGACEGYISPDMCD